MANSVMSLLGWCKACGRYRSSKNLKDFHANPSLTDVRDATSKGCRLCGLVLEALEVCASSESTGVPDLAVLEKRYPKIVIDFGPMNSLLLLEMYSNSKRMRTIRLEIFSMVPVDKDVSKSGWTVGNCLPLSGYTGSDATAEKIRKWTESCVSRHSNCNKGEPTRLPKRVLEIQGDRVLLRENLGSMHRYACLSHCWGKPAPATQLTHATMESLKRGLSIQALPKTFQEAVQMCVTMDLQFFWIDSLCIIQGDVDDWTEAVSTMAGIYQNAYITIAASSARDSTKGLFRHMEERHKPTELPRAGLFVRWQMPHFPSRYHEDVKSWPLLARCWVYQERRLSPRMIHFGRSQVFWQCQSALCSEDGSLNTGYVDKDADKDSGYRQPLLMIEDHPIETWHTMVEEYSTLQITFERDRLPAIAALVDLLMQSVFRKGDEYLAGVWRNTLIADICWSILRGGGKSRPTEWIAPTWSWASVHEEVVYRDKIGLRSEAELLDVSYLPVGPSHVGQLKSASITIRAPYFLTKLHYEQSEYGVQSTFVEDNRQFGGEWEYWQDYDLTTGATPLHEGETVTVLVFGHAEEYGMGNKGSAGFLLREVSDNRFERVGFARNFETLGFWAAGLPVMTATII